MSRIGSTVDRTFVLAVASGKGGTGKTFVATNMGIEIAKRGSRVILVDCDVEAPNDHLFFEREGVSLAPVTTRVAEVAEASCTGCSRCRQACAYGAIRVLGDTAVIFEELCHGCGACVAACPRGAITETPKRVGEVSAGRAAQAESLTLISGTLDIGQVKSPAVIRAARSHARNTQRGSSNRSANQEPELVILDAPPGVACSTVAAINGAHALLLVTEPTPFGLHDLELGVRLGRELRLPMGVVINRDGAGDTDIAAACRSWDVPLLARIPFDRRIAEAYARGELVSAVRPDVAETLASIPDAMLSLARKPVLT